VVHTSQLIYVLVFLAAMLGTVGLGRLVLLGLLGDQRRALSRLREIAPPEKGGPPTSGITGLALFALPRLGELVVPGDEDNLARLKTRLTQAGIYGPNAVAIVLGAQVLLTIMLPATAAVLPFALGVLKPWQAVGVGLFAAGVGLLMPSFWVDYQRRRHQADLRRALPDAIDMLVLCVEGGISLAAGLQRVTAELQIAHPPLAREMNIIQRELQLGMSVGDAVKKFGDRCDMEEVRQLAAVLLQTERYGTSSVKALRLHAESCRQERQQRAEERAQKAAVKILFPTLLCIFPAIFIVIVGPAAYQIVGMLSKMN
jgi:tight adherence protein C